MSIEKSVFGTLNGRDVYAYTLTVGDLAVTLSEYGARVAKVIFAGTSVVCGFDCLDGHLADGDYHGSVVGRYANRISDGKFTLNGKEYTLACNEVARGEHLHGGNVGFSSKVWDVVETASDEKYASIKFCLTSPDGEEGYPGNLTVYVTYTVADEAVTIDYLAETDADTILNLTNHSYFSLSGVGNTILDHKLTLNCGKYVPVNSRLIPLGDLADVGGTPFDFREGKTIGQDIGADDEQLKIGGGYDHCFVRGNGENTETPQWIGTITSPVTGITMEILTTEGGIQMYTGNYMTAPNPFFGTIDQKQNQAVALECNRMPDSPNQKNFPSPVIRAGQKYTQTTVYKFTK